MARLFELDRRAGSFHRLVFHIPVFVEHPILDSIPEHLPGWKMSNHVYVAFVQAAVVFDGLVSAIAHHLRSALDGPLSRLVRVDCAQLRFH